MQYAGCAALRSERENKGIGFETYNTNSSRWNVFAAWAKSEGVRYMENITPQTLQDYAQHMQEKGLATSTIQNCISAVNSVLKIASGGRWQSVRAVTDLNVEKRSNVRTDAPARYSQFKELQSKLDPRQAALIGLCREFGLREKEASLLNAKQALSEALQTHTISVEFGTKGGQPRTVPVFYTQQIEALKTAADLQGPARNLIPEGMKWTEFRNANIRPIQREAAAMGVKGLHTFRAAYACERYEKLTGCPAPCVAGHMVADREVDLAARRQISEELGHHRVDVLSSYVGGRRS